MDKPTWVVNPHDLHFAQDHHLAWSPELEFHLNDEYVTRTLKAERERIVVNNEFGFSSSLDHAQAATPGSPPKDGGKTKGSAKFRNIDL